ARATSWPPRRRRRSAFRGCWTSSSPVSPTRPNNQPRGHRALQEGTMLRRFFAYYRPYRRLLLIDFGAAVLLGLLELAFPSAVQAFVDRLLPSADWPLILLAAVAL